MALWQAAVDTTFVSPVGRDSTARAGADHVSGPVTWALVLSKRAGGGFDSLGDDNTTKLLRWLLRWKRGLLPRAEPGRGAGGHDSVET